MTNQQPPTLANDLLDRAVAAEADLAETRAERDQLRQELDAETARAARADARHLNASNRADHIAAERDRLRITSRTHLLAYDHLNAVTRTLIAAIQPTADIADAYLTTVNVLNRPLESYLHPDELAMINGPRPKINAEGAGGLGSSRRAQDAQPIVYAGDPRRRAVAFNALSRALRVVDRFVSLSERETVTAAVLNALDADRPQSGYFPPSQGQEIPDDQLTALMSDDFLGLVDETQIDAARRAIRSAYRIGFASALGYEITIEDGRVGVGDRPEPVNTEETAEAAAARFAGELEQAQRDLLNERYEHRQTSAAEDEARERAEELGTALTIAHRTLRALEATSRYGVALTGRHGRLVVFGFPTPEGAAGALRVGYVLSEAFAKYASAQVDATLIEPAKLGDPPTVDVDQLLAVAAADLAVASDDAERAEAVEELLEGWYAAWPDTAVTSPHYPIAGELVRLLTGGLVAIVDCGMVDEAALAGAPLEPAIADDEAP